MDAFMRLCSKCSVSRITFIPSTSEYFFLIKIKCSKKVRSPDLNLEENGSDYSKIYSSRKFSWNNLIMIYSEIKRFRRENNFFEMI